METLHAISNNAPEGDVEILLYALALAIAFALTVGGLGLSAGIHALRRRWRLKHGVERCVRLLPHRAHPAVSA